MFGNVAPDERQSPPVPIHHQAYHTSINQYFGANQIQEKRDGFGSRLIIKQSPILGRALGKEKDRKPLDPPPIIQLLDRRANIYDSPYLFMICSLLAQDYEFETSRVEYPSNYLTGCRTSSVHHLKDTTGAYGGFFVFGDLSIRHEGIFRLRFTLYDRVENTGSPSFNFVSEVVSEPVTVYSPKRFPGMTESTLLTRTFCDQGVKLRLRKDGRAIGARKRAQNRADDTSDLNSQTSKRFAYDRGNSVSNFRQGLGSTTPEDFQSRRHPALTAASPSSTSQDAPSISNAGNFSTSASFNPVSYTHNFDQAPVAPMHDDATLRTPYTTYANNSGYPGMFEGNAILQQNPELNSHLSQSYLDGGYVMESSSVQGLSSALAFETKQRDEITEMADTQKVTGNSTSELGGFFTRRRFQ